MALAFSISPASEVPIFRQITQQIQRAVASRALQVGEQLPAVRTLAETLVINPNTVARAYQELIREGLLESRSGRGVFVAERRQVFSEAEQARRLRLLAEQLCHEAAFLGVPWSEVNDLLASTWKELQRKPDAKSLPPSPMNASPVIEIDHLTKFYGSREIVRDLCLTVPPGSIYGFLGRNGMGKTTTIRILLGIEEPTRGRTRVLGEDSSRLSPAARARIGYLPEGHHLYGWM